MQADRGIIPVCGARLTHETLRESFSSRDYESRVVVRNQSISISERVWSRGWSRAYESPGGGRRWTKADINNAPRTWLLRGPTFTLHLLFLPFLSFSLSRRGALHLFPTRTLSLSLSLAFPHNVAYLRLSSSPSSPGSLVSPCLPQA